MNNVNTNLHYEHKFILIKLCLIDHRQCKRIKIGAKSSNLIFFEFVSGSYFDAVCLKPQVSYRFLKQVSYRFLF